MMKFVICLTVVLVVSSISAYGEQQRILRRVIKSTPTATNLARVRLVTVRSASAESGAVAEISSKEAANFGQRGANETTAPSQPSSQAAGIKSKVASPAQTASFTSATSSTTTTTTTAAPTTTSTARSPASPKIKASDRQQSAPTTGAEVELLSSAPSSWQTMTAVEAPAAMLIATGTRSTSHQQDLSSSSSTLHSSSDDSSVTGDFLRAASSTKGSSFTAQQSASETFSRLRQQQQQQQQSKTQQSYFYPQQKVSSKTSNYQSGTKTHWYQPPTTTSTTTPRPAPIIQQKQEQYEQQSEQYVEQQQQQQQQVEYGAAPLGMAEPFAFDFRTQDNSGNGQYRKEESDKNGVVRGSYGYTDANGIYRHVEYVADQNGFRANIKSNEPGLIGETQPASIQYAGGPAKPSNQRLSEPSSGNNGEWVASSENQATSSAELALAPPDFESSHKSERLRARRNYGI